VEESGNPILLDPAQTPSFHQQIGRNTQYIIHPDEILAENFSHLVIAEAGPAEPEIVSKMAELLAVR